jgi:hypothetical protein
MDSANKPPETIIRTPKTFDGDASRRFEHTPQRAHKHAIHGAARVSRRDRVSNGPAVV